MKNGWKVLLIVLSILSMSFAGIIAETSMPEEYSVQLVEVTAKILKNCHDSLGHVVGITEDIPDRLISSLFNENLIVQPITPNRNSKLQLFVLAPITPSKFNSTLDMIRESLSWNYLAHFNIIDQTKDKFGCEKKALEILLIAWKFNIFEAKFLCHDDPAKAPLIFTFNPYTNEFPPPWTMISIHRVEFNNSWTLLSRRAQKNGNLCENLNFDKTKNLADYPVDMMTINFSDRNRSTLEKRWKIDRNSFEVDMPSLFRRDIFAVRAITIALASAHIPPSVNLEEVVYELRIKCGDCSEGDTYISERPIYRSPLDWTLPRRYNEIHIASQRGLEELQLKKILTITDQASQISYLCIFISTMIFFKFFLPQTLAGAALATLKMFLSSSLTKVPKDVGSRIYVVSLFIFIAMLLGIYLGKLSSLLAKRVYLSNIDSFDDLRDSDHVIYGPYRYESLFPEFEFGTRFIVDDDENQECMRELRLKNAAVVCVDDWSKLLPIANKFNLHLSKNPVPSPLVGWVVTPNWPLEARTHSLIQLLVEADVAEMKIVKKINAQKLADLRQNNLRDDSPKVLRFEDLKFVFIFLGVGLTFATISFVAEFIYGYVIFKMWQKALQEEGRIEEARVSFRPTRVGSIF